MGRSFETFTRLRHGHLSRRGTKAHVHISLLSQREDGVGDPGIHLLLSPRASNAVLFLSCWIANFFFFFLSPWHCSNFQIILFMWKTSCVRSCQRAFPLTLSQVHVLTGDVGKPACPGYLAELGWAQFSKMELKVRFWEVLSTVWRWE